MSEALSMHTIMSRLEGSLARDIIAPVPADKIYEVAEMWVGKALLHLRNEEHYKAECRRLEQELLELRRASRDFPPPEPDSTVTLAAIDAVAGDPMGRR